MPGNHSRRKGAGGEREVAALLPGARKVSYMYRPGPDVIWEDREVEVKRFAKPISQKIVDLLENAQIVIERANYGDWFVHMRLDELLDMREEWIDGEGTDTSNTYAGR